MWGWFTSIGTFVSGLLGILFVIKLLSSIINTGINFTILFQTFEWSIKLVAGVLTSITQLLLHKEHKKNYTNNKTTITKQYKRINPDLRRLSI